MEEEGERERGSSGEGGRKSGRCTKACRREKARFFRHLADAIYLSTCAANDPSHLVADHERYTSPRVIRHPKDGAVVADAIDQRGAAEELPDAGVFDVHRFPPIRQGNVCVSASSTGNACVPHHSLRALPAKTKVESGTTQSESGTFVHLENSGKHVPA